MQKLGSYELEVIREKLHLSDWDAENIVAHVAKEILDGVSHDLVRKFYRRCYKGVL